MHIISSGHDDTVVRTDHAGRFSLSFKPAPGSRIDLISAAYLVGGRVQAQTRILKVHMKAEMPYGHATQIATFDYPDFGAPSAPRYSAAAGGLIEFQSYVPDSGVSGCLLTLTGGAITCTQRQTRWYAASGGASVTATKLGDDPDEYDDWQLTLHRQLDQSDPATLIGYSTFGIPSDDGTTIAYEPVPAGSPGGAEGAQVAVWRGTTGTSTVIAESPDTNEQRVTLQDMTPDGRYVLYAVDRDFSDRTLIRYDVATGAQTIVANMSRQTTPDTRAAMSADGSAVTFGSDSQGLLKDAGCKRSVRPSIFGAVYLWRDGVLRLVSKCHALSTSDAPTISPDGRYLAFVSTDPALTGELDNDGLADAIWYDSTTGVMHRVNGRPKGKNPYLRGLVLTDGGHGVVFEQGGDGSGVASTSRFMRWTAP